MPEYNNSRQRTDEEIANALQEQYRQEFLQRQARRNARNRATAPLENFAAPPPPPPPPPPTAPTATAIPKTTGTHSAVEVQAPATEANDDADARLAKQLQMEWNSSMNVAPPTFPTAPPRRAASSEPLLFDTDDINADMDDDQRMAQQLQDEELARRFSRMQDLQSTQTSSFLDERSDSMDDSMAEARRIAQEMHDAEMAQRLSVYEQEALQRAQREHNVQQRQQPKSLMMRVLPLLCCGVAISIPVLFVLGVFDNNDASDFFGDLGDAWIDTDPWKGETASPPSVPGQSPGVAEGSAFRWANKGQGLSLTILNAMDDSWQVDLQKAVQNWEEGFPVDPLSLSMQRIPYEFDCDAVEGKMKICNGNYGNTRWRGINEVVLNRRTNTIVSSAARMNEFYLPNGGKQEQRLYTLCHELGHGFGLPHWDEDFYNDDLGNCMDYTSRPQNNKQPDASNFLYLGELYGNVTSVSQTLSENTNGNGRRRANQHQQQQQRLRRQTTMEYDTVHPDDGKSRLLVANDRMQVHWRELEKSPDLIHVYQYLLK